MIEFELKRELAILRESKVDPRWEEWVEECLNIMKVTYCPSTLYGYEKTLSKWVNSRFKGRELKDITKLDVHNLLYEGVSPETTLHTRKWILKIIKRVFQMAVDHGKLDRNPCNGMMVKVPESEKRVLTNKEVELFLSEARSTNHRYYPIWVMALFTGMRSGELYALKWTDVDLDNGTISVSKSWSSMNGFTSTKNQKARIVPISGELSNFLKELKLERAKEEFVLPHPTEWTRGEAAKVIKSFCKSIQITEIRFHDLRATFITNLLARGESLARVMAIVGHADMETTNVYLRKAGIELKDGTERLGYKLPAIQAQMEREIIRNRVIAGLQNAKAKGKRIGRERKRNDALIHSLLDAGLSFREISRIARCSHGSVSASKRELLAKKAALKALEEQKTESGPANATISQTESTSPTP